MKTYAYLWQYLAQFFLYWEMFQAKVLEKIKTHIFCLITLFQIQCPLWDNVEKYGRDRQATVYIIIWRMRFARCIIKATHTNNVQGYS